MRSEPRNYDLYFKFINAYAPFGFRGVDRNSQLLLDLDKLTERNDQYFFAGDLLQGMFAFVSSRSTQMIGVEPAHGTPHENLEAVHPAEKSRNTNAWAKLLHMANELLEAKGGSSLLSVNMRMRDPKGKYREVLFQCYLFYSRLPYETVFVLIIITDIGWFKGQKTGFHYYAGNDLSNFRYPDSELLMIGHYFTRREFEVIKLVERGLSSDEIADRLFISVGTVDTHRKNILSKTEKHHISDLIYELKDEGLI